MIYILVQRCVILEQCLETFFLLYIENSFDRNEVVFGPIYPQC